MQYLVLLAFVNIGEYAIRSLSALDSFRIPAYGLQPVTLLPPPGSITFPNEPIKDALYLHNTSISNNTLRDCTFRPSNQKEACPDFDTKFILYSGKERQEVDSYSTDWLRQSIWDPNKENVFLVHGYAGGDDTLPIVVLRDGKNA